MKILTFLMLLFALSLRAQTNSIAAPYGANHFNVQYGEAAGQKLFLDAHVPDGPGPFPTLIIVHGGGWMASDKEKDIVPVLAPYATNFTWFTVNYRLAPTNHWPACFDDLQTAVRWVKQHATEYKGIIVIANGQHQISDWSHFDPGWQKRLINWLSDKLEAGN